MAFISLREAIPIGVDYLAESAKSSPSNWDNRSCRGGSFLSIRKINRQNQGLKQNSVVSLLNCVQHWQNQRYRCWFSVNCCVRAKHSQMSNFGISKRSTCALPNSPVFTVHSLHRCAIPISEWLSVRWIICRPTWVPSVPGEVHYLISCHPDDWCLWPPQNFPHRLVHGSVWELVEFEGRLDRHQSVCLYIGAPYASCADSLVVGVLLLLSSLKVKWRALRYLLEVWGCGSEGLWSAQGWPARND